jgi:hypothetical protein
MEQQLKQQLMQKKIYANLSQKEKESTVFSILPFAKIVPTILKNHHPPSYQKVAYTFQNDI